MNESAKQPLTDELRDAIALRESTYDGVFVYAVLTTGIYCRPGCPARTPLRKNVEVYVDSGNAEAAGYRPCLRCRPNDGRTPAEARVARALALVDHILDENT